MCFHTIQTKEALELENRFSAKFENVDLYTPSFHYNGFDFPKTPIITKNNPAKIQMVSWGLVPHWADHKWNRAYTLNARIETINEKPSFREYTENRCIILVDGFFEWQHDGRKRIKYKIGFKGQLFTLAGLFSKVGNQKSYTILTAEAKGIMRGIHNSKMRMPIAFKNDAEINLWLDKNVVKPRFDFSAYKLQ